MHQGDLAVLGLTSSDDQGKSFCPVIDDWSNSKWEFCMQQWHSITDQNSRTHPCTEGDFNVDEKLVWPIKHSDSPAVHSFGQFSNDGIVELLEMTRSICDDDPDIHCWMSGVSFAIAL
jgi:hypothetical protein